MGNLFSSKKNNPSSSIQLSTNDTAELQKYRQKYGAQMKEDNLKETAEQIGVPATPDIMKVINEMRERYDIELNKQKERTDILENDNLLFKQRYQIANQTNTHTTDVLANTSQILFDSRKKFDCVIELSLKQADDKIKLLTEKRELTTKLNEETYMKYHKELESLNTQFFGIENLLQTKQKAYDDSFIKSKKDKEELDLITTQRNEISKSIDRQENRMIQLKNNQKDSISQIKQDIKETENHKVYLTNIQKQEISLKEIPSMLEEIIKTNQANGLETSHQANETLNRLKQDINFAQIKVN